MSASGTWSHSEQKQSVAPTARDLYLITFTAPINQEARERVAQLIEPVKLETYIPDNTFLVYITHQQGHRTNNGDGKERIEQTEAKIARNGCR